MACDAILSVCELNYHINEAGFLILLYLQAAGRL